MSKLGPIYLSPQVEDSGYGFAFSQPTENSPTMQAKIDTEIKRIIDEAYKQAKEILKKNQRQLALVADKLIKQETLDGEEFAALMKSK